MAQFSTLEVAPAVAHKSAGLRAWLLGVAVLVFLMVSVGGATRLTGSGLSITEWRPIVGIVPPLSQADWLDLFAKYQQIPQYEHLNKGMSLDAFKAIFWWEWIHRFLGRLVGAAFLLPVAYFLAARQISRALMGRLAAIFALGGLQGLIGWYMVSSGLAERTDVSQYRLALHLALAVLILAALLWTALSLRHVDGTPARKASVPAASLIMALLFVQILLGALVAGLKAGQAYNTWPLMDGQWIPSGLGAIEPWYLNLFENAMTVQFNHRIAAYVIAVAVLWRLVVVGSSQRQRAQQTSALALALGVFVQLALGIWTLLSQVAPLLGIAHQAMAATVFALAVWHLYESRHPRAAYRCQT